MIYRKTSKTIAEKRKRTNSGGQDITQNNRQYNGQKESLSVYYCVDRCLSFCLFVSWPLCCLFVCVLFCRPLFIFLSFCFLGRHNNTQTNRQYSGQETKGQIENGRHNNT
jgi:hypothetical protein